MMDHHCRFLAKEFGFAGKDNAEQAQADEMVDVIVDLIDEQVFIFCYIFQVIIVIIYLVSDPASLWKGRSGKEEAPGEADSFCFGKGGISQVHQDLVP